MGADMGLLSFLGSLSPFHIHFVTLVTGARRMGTDSFGNVYYESKARKGYNHPRRWVMYRGLPEPSLVPPEWHGWLHYQTDERPSDDALSFRRTWQKPHKPNMTGTDQAYLPPGHVLRGMKRAPSSSDYEAWSPEASTSSTKKA